MENQAQPPAMEEVFRLFFPIVYNYVYYKTLDKTRTEAIVSRVFLHIMCRPDQLPSHASDLEDYLLSVADLLIEQLGHLREQAVSRSEESSALLVMLSQLPEKERMFVYYRYYLDNCSIKTARRLGLNADDVSALHTQVEPKVAHMLQKHNK